MISADDEHGVLPQLEIIHQSENLPQVVIAHAQQRGVFMARMRHLVRRLLHFAIGRPVKMQPLIVMGIECPVVLLGKERLVRVKGLNLQEPIVGLGIAADEVNPRAKGARLGLLLLPAHEGPVHPILPPAVMIAAWGHRLRDVGRSHLPDPGITLLTAMEIPGAVTGVIGRAAVLEVVIVVRAEMGIDAMLAQQFRHGIVERLQRPPTAVQKAVASRVQIAPRRHTRHAAHIRVVKGHAALGQPRKVGRMRPVTAIGRQHPPVERVEHDHDGAHGYLLLGNSFSVIPSR